MLNNLRAELARKGLEVSAITDVVGKTDRSNRDKIRGISTFSITDAIKIRDNLFPGMSLEYLFARDEEKYAS